MEAPNFMGEYPNAGAMIGPAWREAWRLLQHGRWMHKTALMLVMQEASGCKRKTASNLLGAAVAAGVLEIRVSRIGGVVSKEYRRA